MVKFSKVILIFVLFLIFLFSISYAQVSKKIYINRVNSIDGALIEPAKSYLVDRLRGLGFEVVFDKEQADYLVELNIVNASSRRSFNWLILIFPLWPIVPFTTVEGEAVVAVRFLDKNGSEVFFDQTGAVRNGRWFFGDFVSESSVVKDAVYDCINKLTSRLDIR